MRVFQVLPVLAYGDAIGNDTLAIQDVVRGMGIETGIYYTDHMDGRMPEGTASPVSRMTEVNDDDILIYHECTADPFIYQLPGYKGKKVMVYHNITPSEFFHLYNPETEKIQKKAREGLRFLADKVDYCIADSAYNRQELLDAGYRCPIDVCPIVIPFGDYDQAPDRFVINQMRRGKVTNLLFVGRISPNKKQEDIIRGFYDYQRRYNPRSRLVLIGSDRGMGAYSAALKNHIRQLGIEKKVLFPGHISFSKILAYYRTADIFVCMSEHEGFCVPLLEAMHFGIPIAAYRSTAIPDTLGGGGLLLESKKPEYVSAAIHRILTDQPLRNHLAGEQKRVLSRFSHEETIGTMAACVKRAVAISRT